jgi:hypothetical protein
MRVVNSMMWHRPVRHKFAEISEQFCASILMAEEGGWYVISIGWFFWLCMLIAWHILTPWRRKRFLWKAGEYYQTTHRSVPNDATIKSLQRNKQKTCSLVLVRERTIPTELPPLVGEVSGNFLRTDCVAWAAQRFSTAVFSAFKAGAANFYIKYLLSCTYEAECSRPTTSQKIG